ncbi:hypothetical protein QBC35DRAFT_183759 [Podospora australis]|uniref:Uncharacterized protein n=1 Tax=Podospora australis TaxID=1536484 RepID=A0AAN6WWZ0_9PEZI|nr:hypothetical protein QBC35DRAFT_183759 [Podospora australis]
MGCSAAASAGRATGREGYECTSVHHHQYKELVWACRSVLVSSSLGRAKRGSPSVHSARAHTPFVCSSPRTMRCCVLRMEVQFRCRHSHRHEFEKGKEKGKKKRLPCYAWIVQTYIQASKYTRSWQWLCRLSTDIILRGGLAVKCPRWNELMGEQQPSIGQMLGNLEDGDFGPPHQRRPPATCSNISPIHGKKGKRTDRWMEVGRKPGSEVMSLPESGASKHRPTERSG